VFLERELPKTELSCYFPFQSLLSFAPVSLDVKHLDKPARSVPSCDNAVDFSRVIPLCVIVKS